MKFSMVFLSSLLFIFSSLAFASSSDTTSPQEDRAQVTACASTQSPSTAVQDFVGNDGAINHSCSCEGTQACSVSCAYDKSAKCGKDIYGYCSCSCQ